MKKATITVAFDEEKLHALEFSLKKAGSSVQARLEQTLGQLYEQTAPAPARAWHCVASPQKIRRRVMLWPITISSTTTRN